MLWQWVSMTKVIYSDTLMEGEMIEVTLTYDTKYYLCLFKKQIRVPRFLGKRLWRGHYVTTKYTNARFTKVSDCKLKSPMLLEGFRYGDK